jgi:uncharacterized protein (DUF2336 family)
LNDDQIAVFDDVLRKLIERIETRALVELSSRLAPIGNAPIETIRRLAWSDEIAVAGPVLSGSARLTTNDLVKIAATKSPAISSGNFGAPQARRNGDRRLGGARQP